MKNLDIHKIMLSMVAQKELVAVLKWIEAETDPKKLTTLLKLAAKPFAGLP